MTDQAGGLRVHLCMPTTHSREQFRQERLHDRTQKTIGREVGVVLQVNSFRDDAASFPDVMDPADLDVARCVRHCVSRDFRRARSTSAAA